MSDGAPARRRIARVVAPMLLLVGGALAWGNLKPRVPTDHDVVIRFARSARDVTRLEATWVDPAAPEQPVTGQTLRFPPGSAPPSISMNVRLPDGRWDLQLAIDRSANPPLRLVRHIDLQPGQLIVPLEDLVR